MKNHSVLFLRVYLFIVIHFFSFTLFSYFKYYQNSHYFLRLLWMIKGLSISYTNSTLFPSSLLIFIRIFIYPISFFPFPLLCLILVHLMSELYLLRNIIILLLVLSHANKIKCLEII